MPIKIKNNEVDSLEFEEFIDLVRGSGVNTVDDIEFLELAPYLKRLSNNKHFLAKRIQNELKNYNEFQKENSYTQQVFMLMPPSPECNFFVRANVWPSKDDYLCQINGSGSFFYGKPHDHNFNFLTVGYKGSGYWSDYYEYDYKKVIGFPGEDVELKYIETTNLAEGDMMLYRAHIDVHNQLPADDLSITINIMESSLRTTVTDQYAFDLKSNKVDEILNRKNALICMRLAMAFSDGNGYDIVEHISDNHVSNSIRMAAIDAIALGISDPSQRIAFYEEKMKDNSLFVNKNCMSRLKALGG